RGPRAAPYRDPGRFRPVYAACRAPDSVGMDRAGCPGPAGPELDTLDAIEVEPAPAVQARPVDSSCCFGPGIRDLCFACGGIAVPGLVAGVGTFRPGHCFARSLPGPGRTRPQPGRTWPPVSQPGELSSRLGG